jgi:hypothetical protein
MKYILAVVASPLIVDCASPAGLHPIYGQQSLSVLGGLAVDKHYRIWNDLKSCVGANTIRSV